MKNSNAIGSQPNKDAFEIESIPGDSNFVESKIQKKSGLGDFAKIHPIELSTNGIFIANQEAKIISWNEEMEILTGVKQEEAINQYVWDLVYTFTPRVDQNAAFREMLKKRFLTTINDFKHWEKRDYEHRLVTAAGSVISVELSTFVSVSPNGNLLVVNVKENDRQKQISKMDSHDEFAFVAKLNRFAVDLSRLNPDENMDAFISTRLKDFVGALGIVYSEYMAESRTLTPKHIEFDPGLLEELVPLFDQHVHKIHSVLHDYMYHELIINTIRVNNSLFELSFGTIPYTVSNSVQAILHADHFLRVTFQLKETLFGTALLAIRNDFPEPPTEILHDFVSLACSAIRNRNLQKSLQKDEEILRTVSECSADTIWYLDEDGRIIYSNREIPGYGKTDIIGRHFSEWTLPEYHALLFESFSSVLSNGKPLEYQSRALGFNQEIRWYSSRLTPVQDGEKVKNVVLTISDITEFKKKEQALLVSEENYRVISQSTFDAIFIIDKSGELLFLNKSVEAVLGYRIEEMLGRSFSDFLPGNQVENYQRQLTNMFLYAEALMFESVMFHADGRLLDVEINIKPITLKGEFVAQGSVRNISFEKQTERQLKESLSRNLDLLKSIPQTILVIDSNAKISEFYPADGHWLWANTTSVIGHTAETIFPGQTGVLIQENIDKVKASGKEYFQTFELDGNGTLHYFEVKFMPYGDSEVLLMISDVTAEKQAEETLRLSAESYLDIFNSVPEPIFLFNESGIIRDVNRSAENTYQLTKSGFIGKTLEAFSCPGKNNFDEIARLFNCVAETGEQVQFDFCRKSNDGREVYEEIIINRGKYFGELILVAVAHDITEKQLAEEKLKIKNQELESLNLEKDKFFSIIAHDLRSPFNSFLGLTQLMIEDLANMSFSDIKNMALAMGRSADNLYGLLENLLEWSRFQRGMISFSPKEIVLAEKAKEITRSLIDASVKKGIELNFAIPADLIIRADEYMLSSIVRNLTSNAIKFTPKDGKVTISARRSDGGLVELSVGDSGIGMDDEMIHKLFNLNEYTNRQGTEGELSTGLGLILCKEFVEKHNGKIWVESKVGEGSTFRITIPTGQEDSSL